MTAETPATPGKYFAFISYSHQDKQVGDWLHKSLEVYKVPKKLVGTQGRDGAVSSRVFPIFRDREELPTSADLGGNIRLALEQSRYLIVICSTKSARSQWVNEEILAYKRLGRGHRILCLIVDGEPNASDKGMPEQECFPQAVRFSLGADGNLTEQRCEPIAADARPGKDGKANALLKLLAGLLGVNFDDLRQRDRQRQKNRRTWMAVAVIACMLTVTGVWLEFDLQQRNKILQAESLRLYKLAAEELKNNNHDTALLLALNALPGKYGGKRPFVPEVAGVLSTALSKLRLTTVYPHDKPVRHVAISRDGKKIAVVLKDDNVARLWNIEDGAQLATLQHKSQVTHVGFSPDSTKIITSSYDGTSVTWDALNGTRQGELLHEGGVWMAGFSHDAEKIVTISKLKNKYTQKFWNYVLVWSDGEISAVFNSYTNDVQSAVFSPDDKSLLIVSGNDAMLYDFNSDTLLADFKHTEKIQSAVFSPDGRRVLTASYDGTAVIWDAETKKPLHTLRHTANGKAAAVTEATFNHNGTRVATSSFDNTATIWSADTGESLATFSENSIVYSARYSLDGSRLLSATSRSLSVWDVKTKRLIAEYRYKGHINNSEFTPDGTQVLTSTDDGRITRWNVSPAPQTAVLGHAQRVDDAIFSPDRRSVLTISADTAIVWDMLTAKKTAEFSEQDDIASGVLSNDGRLVATATRDGLVSVWDVANNRQKASFHHNSYASSVAFSPDDRQLVSASWDGSTVVWDIASATKINSFQSERYASWYAYVKAVTFSPDGKHIAIANELGRVIVYDVLSGKQQAEFKHASSVTYIKYTADGKAILTVSEDKTAALWDISLNKQLAVYQHKDAVIHASYSPDNKYVVTASKDATAVVWDAREGRHIATLQHDADVYHAEFSPDGRRLITASRDASAVVWDLASKTRMAVYEHDAAVLRARFSPDGSSIISASADATATLWSLPPMIDDPALVELAIGRLPRNRRCLSADERKTYLLPELDIEAINIRGCTSHGR